MLQETDKRVLLQMKETTIMSENDNQKTFTMDSTFLKSRRGIVKVAETVTLFVSFVCFATASTPTYLAATVLEFLITGLLLLFYQLKLNKRFTFLFWPIVDVFNSVFAAVYLIVLSLMALTSYPITGSLVGGAVCLISAGLLSADGYMLFKNITFNKSRNETKNQTNE
ncbi:proteolipid protein 2 [Cyprinodon tularosa]|uniref:Proteolipid protein 2-like n=1 Tax=Cyprinodon variegatus TaxID=28743 RepID=A0A3Q2FXV0_CYPVA|nr:PREDICTED: proteolipid protein 2-like [Cyprinodon variegatus]XP_038139834.1 proteolipid protein 2 [Cyprinodon tularosa]